MPRFAANLSMMYVEQPFLDRFAAAAADGFRAVEYLFPYEWPADVLAARLAQHGLEQVLFNAPPGDFAGGERGIACLPGREAEFRSGGFRVVPGTRVDDRHTRRHYAGCDREQGWTRAETRDPA